MDGETAQLSVDRRYVRLVRLAYLVLPATGRRRYRLAIAQRIVDNSLSRPSWRFANGGRGFAPTRARVLRYAMRPPRRFRVGLARRLRSLPQGGPPTAPRWAARGGGRRTAGGIS
jgi:hypothetical protein